MKPKPLYGDACNRCGLCCLVSPCAVANVLLNQYEGACQAIRRDGLGGWVCGFATEHPSAAVREAAAVATGAGVGCDMAHTPADAVARATRKPGMTAAARVARRNASPEAQALLRSWRLAPP